MSQIIHIGIHIGWNSQNIDSIYVIIPIGSMYGIFIYIWHKSMVTVGKYSIHGSYGIVFLFCGSSGCVLLDD